MTCFRIDGLLLWSLANISILNFNLNINTSSEYEIVSLLSSPDYVVKNIF